MDLRICIQWTCIRVLCGQLHHYPPPLRDPEQIYLSLSWSVEAEDQPGKREEAAAAEA